MKLKIFSKKEIIGLELALETITKGEQMLDKLTKQDQKILTEFVMKIEKDNLIEIFLK